jgi:hypothetical protein
VQRSCWRLCMLGLAFIAQLQVPSLWLGSWGNPLCGVKRQCSGYLCRGIHHVFSSCLQRDKMSLYW